MELNSVKLGKYIELLNNKNIDKIYSEKDVRGVNNKKELIYTKADISGRDLSRFSIVNPGEFFFNHRTSRNGSKFSITYNYVKNPIIVTEDYTVFKIKEEFKSEILSDWLYIYFNRPELDRYVITNSWGSSTEFFNWDDICNIELIVPSYNIQLKYCKIYKTIQNNQKIYEKNLYDLKLICDSYIEKLRRENEKEPIGKYIVCTDRKTDNSNLQIMGISNQRRLVESNSRTKGVNKSKYLKIEPREFAYSPIHINDGSIAFNNTKNEYLLSPIYKTFKVVNEEKLNSEYLMMWFSREEFTRYCWFYAFGSARDQFDWKQLCEIEIPVPDINIQKSIAELYNSYILRRNINEELKEKLKDICPILIKGSIEEAKSC